MLLPALMLAAAGVHSASRAWGTNAGGAYERYTPLASQRLARSRTLTLLVIALCAFLTIADDCRTETGPFHRGGDFRSAWWRPLWPSPLLHARIPPMAPPRFWSAWRPQSVSPSLEGRVPDPEKLLIGALMRGGGGIHRRLVGRDFLAAPTRADARSPRLVPRRAARRGPLIPRPGAFRLRFCCSAFAGTVSLRRRLRRISGRRRAQANHRAPARRGSNVRDAFPLACPLLPRWRRRGL